MLHAWRMASAKRMPKLREYTRANSASGANIELEHYFRVSARELFWPKEEGCVGQLRRM